MELTTVYSFTLTSQVFLTGSRPVIRFASERCASSRFRTPRLTIVTVTLRGGSGSGLQVSPCRKSRPSLLRPDPNRVDSCSLYEHRTATVATGSPSQRRASRVASEQSCKGYTLWVSIEAGRSLPRVAESIALRRTPVARSHVLPLRVSFSRPRSPSLRVPRTRVPRLVRSPLARRQVC